MKLYFSIAAAYLCLYANLSNAQLLNQDASGKSTIIESGSTVSLDFSQALANINYFKSIPQKKDNKSARGLIIGGQLQGRSAGGWANLFSDGKFTPEGNLSVLAGGYTRLRKIRDNDNYEWLLEERVKCNEERNEKGRLLDEKIFPGLINKHWQVQDCGSSDSVLTLLKAAMDSKTKLIEKLEKLEKDIREKASFDRCDLQAVKSIHALVEDLRETAELERFIALTDKLDKLRTEINDYSKRVVRTGRLTYYFRAGVSARGFKYDNGEAIKQMDTRFTDVSSVEPYFEIGTSWRLNACSYLGITAGAQYFSNFGALAQSAYALVSQDSIGNSVLQTKTEISAYSGAAFIRKWGAYVNADYLFLLPLEQAKSMYLGISPYIRLNFPGVSAYLDSFRATAGLGGYFINGNSGAFQGGIYLQTSDLNKENYSHIGKTITFGLVSKFNLSGIAL
jgi:Txe/YoeB family toxin of Txe-Axe toxin-antitoxin module